jgi:ubiquinone/menaquinone biosynthesis C-methylase UbiE
VNDLEAETYPLGKRILDCGAGGPVPPLSVFAAQGLETWGIDISDAQLEKARAFGEAKSLDLRLHRGDMRRLPFREESFDVVYEHYAMCHLSKKDTAQAIREMYRVLRPRGRCFLGLISAETWPPLGCEREPGEFWVKEGKEATRHSVFTDPEAERLMTGWRIIRKERSITWLASRMKPMTRQDWLELYQEIRPKATEDAWLAKYNRRLTEARYVHTFYMLRKHT